jgi:MoaA/NifB/PqqE/SkfB family radical SAM enzyme
MVVEKAKSEGYDVIGIYNWTEPFLANTLPEYVSVVREFGLYCDVSSNLSLKYFDTIERSLVAGIDRLTVSVSGYSQAVYEINHIGGNISWVKENLERISELRREGIISARIFLRLIKFDYNIKEEPVLKDYASSLGVEFEVINGVCHPDNPVSSYASEEYFLNRLKNFTSSRIYENNGEICPLILDTLSIDSEGNIYVCCAYPNYSCLRIGAYLEIPKDDLLLNRYTHPICISCAFPRRKATESDCKALVGAMKSRLGNPNE